MTTKGQEKKNPPLTLPTEAYVEMLKFYQHLPLPRNVDEHRRWSAERAVKDEKLWYAVIENKKVQVDYSPFGYYNAMLKGKREKQY